MAHNVSSDAIECVWLADDAICELMKSCRCRGETCTFRKTATQKRQSDENWRFRMSSLPEEEQTKIAKKYYGGNKPWK